MIYAPGILGFGAAAAGSLLLLLLVLTTRHNSIQRQLLIISAAVSTVWGALSAIQLHSNLPINLALTVDTFRNATWLLLLHAAIIGPEDWRALFKPVATRVTLLLVTSVATIEFFTPALSHYVAPSQFYVLHLAQPVLALWLIENLYRRTEPMALWAMKPLCLGLGAVYIYDFVIFSDAVLTKTLTREFWQARGWLLLAALPFVLLTARRAQNWSTKVFVSRAVIFHSTLLAGAGGYMLLMALAGYYIRLMGGNWGSIAQIIFLALGGLLLASLFLSEQLRRKLKVFIIKHFFANKYEYRDEWMRFAAALDDDPEDIHQAALHAIVKPFDCEHAVLALKQGSGFKVVAAFQDDSLEPEIQCLLNNFANQSLEHDWIVDIKELRLGDDKLPFQYPKETLDTITTLNLVIPLTHEGGSLGVCLMSQPESTEAVNWEDRDLMRVIARQLSVHLNLHRANQALTESQQFDTFNRMSAFLVHDLKNILAQLQLLNKNAEKHRHNPEFIDDAFETVDAAAQRLNKVLTQLRNKRAEGEADKRFEVEQALAKVLTTCSTKLPKPSYEFDIEGIELCTNQERFTNIICHLLQNAQDATSDDGSIHIQASHVNELLSISIKDTGIGMTEDFISNRLFKPFDTTKGNAGMGIGAYDAKKFAENLGGELIVISEPQQGSEFIIKLPIHTPLINA